VKNELVENGMNQVPVNCRDCSNLCGQTHGGNLLVCGMHPYGPSGDICDDFEDNGRPDFVSMGEEIKQIVRDFLGAVYPYLREQTFFIGFAGEMALERHLSVHLVVGAPGTVEFGRALERASLRAIKEPLQWHELKKSGQLRVWVESWLEEQISNLQIAGDLPLTGSDLATAGSAPPTARDVGLGLFAAINASLNQVRSPTAHSTPTLYGLCEAYWEDIRSTLAHCFPASGEWSCRKVEREYLPDNLYEFETRSPSGEIFRFRVSACSVFSQEDLLHELVRGIRQIAERAQIAGQFPFLFEDVITETENEEEWLYSRLHVVLRRCFPWSERWSITKHKMSFCSHSFQFSTPRVGFIVACQERGRERKLEVLSCSIASQSERMRDRSQFRRLFEPPSGGRILPVGTHALRNCRGIPEPFRRVERSRHADATDFQDHWDHFRRQVIPSADTAPPTLPEP
jgi:hypothetical protein